MKNSNHYIEYDIIRVFATVLVIIGHSTYLKLLTPYGGIDIDLQNISIFQKIIYKINFLIYSFHMPLFFFLSGALLYLTLIKLKMNLRKLLVVKFKRLIIPFIVVTLFYVFPLKYISGYFSYSSKNIALSLWGGNIIIRIKSFMVFGSFISNVLFDMCNRKIV